jgi:hypothetical protein
MNIKALRYSRVLVCAASLLSAFAAAAAQQYGIMNWTNGWLQQWQADSAVMSLYEAPASYPDLRGSVNLLSHLHYVPAERDQGHTGTCWLWGCTAVMSMDFDIKKGGTPILTNGFSVQFAVSYGRFVDTSLNDGGTPQTVKRFYDGVGYCVPWGNTNAAWTDGSGVNKTPSAWIQTQPRYPVGAIALSRIQTYELTEAEAIANIKSALDAQHPLWFNYLLANETDWQVFFDYWRDGSESDIIDLAYGKNHRMDLTTGGGHIVACVGYNDQDPNPANHYWLMLNSWGTANGRRPNGLFRMAMHTDYSARLETAPGYYTPMFTWGMLDSEFPADLSKGVNALNLDLPRATPAACVIQINGVSFPVEQTPTNVVAASLDMNDRSFECDPTTGAWQQTASGFHFQSTTGIVPTIQLDINTNTLLWSMAITNADEDRYIDPHDGIYFALSCSPTQDVFLPPLGGLRAFAYDELNGAAAHGYTNKPTLTITGPTNNALILLGQTNTITWTSTGLAGETLLITITGGTNTTTIADFVPAGAGQYQWIIPWGNWTNASCQVSIKVQGELGVIWTGPIFSIATNITPTVVVRAPAGGEQWPVGARRSVSLDTYNVSGNLTLELLRGGSVVDTITNIAAAAGRCHYAIPAGTAPGTNYAIRLASATTPQAVAVSQPFSVVGQALTPKSWTILFYFDGDNDTVKGQLPDLASLGQLGSSSNVNYVCQMARMPGYITNYGNWYGTRRFYISKGMLPYPENACQAPGALNMSRPETLTDFINWAADNYPAQNYFLILSDHGDGWSGGLLRDDTCGGTWMSTRGLQQALEQADTPMNILGLDMCEEADIEVAYQVRNSGPQVFIASQYMESRDWPYRTVFAQLEGKLDEMSYQELSALFCESFVAQYTNTLENATLGVIQLDKLDPLTAAIAGFADTMVTNYLNMATVRQQAESVKTAFNDAVFYCAKSMALQQQVYGLNLNFPINSDSSGYSDYNTAIVDFPADSHWVTFLTAYYQHMTNSWIGLARQAASSANDHVDLYRFCQFISPSTNDFRVTFASVGPGSTFPIQNGSVFVTNGQSLNIQADPNNETLVTNHFVRWLGDANAQIADPFAVETTLQATGDTLALAYFSSNKDNYTVRFVTEGNGRLNGTNLIEMEVLAGHSSSPVHAVPDSGCVFSGWGGDFPASGNPLVLTNVQMDTTVIAYFWPVTPAVSIQMSNSTLLLAWPAAPSGFALESTGNLPAGPWAGVPGVTSNSITLPLNAGSQFFRLRQTNDTFFDVFSGY